MIYSFYVYTRTGSCLYQEKWNVKGSKTINYSDPDEEKRLLFGLLFSLKEFVTKIAPSNPPDYIVGETLTSYTTPPESMRRYMTDTYTCHQYETPSGLHFILMTDNHTGDLTAVLKHIYTHIYVDSVVNNPLSDVHTAKTIDSQLFRVQLKQYIEGLACFR